MLIFGCSFLACPVFTVLLLMAFRILGKGRFYFISPSTFLKIWAFFILRLSIPSKFPSCFTGELLDAGVNRSPSSYLNNPAAERSKYKYDVDKEMTLIKFVNEEWGPIGSFNWFATHGTSMSRTNPLISGDNKGAAARFMEDWFEQRGSHNGFNSPHSNNPGTDRVPRRISSLVHNPLENGK